MKSSGNLTHDDGVFRARDVLVRLGCPDVEFGEGTHRFPQNRNGRSGPTPDLVAGRFAGSADPSTFFIDVVSPTGDYMFNSKAGGGATAEYLATQVQAREAFPLSAIPLDYARPLLAALQRKAVKYAKGRDDSPLLGIAGYFDDAIKDGGAAFASLGLFRAMNAELGLSGYQQIEEVLIGPGGDSLVATEVNWDLPLAFVFYLRLTE